MRRGMVVGAALALGVLAPVAAPTNAAATKADGAGDVLPFDFDGDGFADLAVGVPGEDLRGVTSPGVVQVMYGSDSGVTARDQLWHQGRKGVKNKLEKRDSFGGVLTSGDFDADGYADLAVGIPSENLGSIVDAGAVQVLYGGPKSLTARDQIWHQGKPGVPGRSERDDLFGESLAAGDFDADGYADLAIGVRGESVGDVDNAGRVVVLRGAPGGLTAVGIHSWRQGKDGIASQPSRGDGFGAGLATGDVNGDGHDDLAITAGSETDAQSPEGGRSSAAHLLLGGPTGLTSVGSQYILPNDLVDYSDRIGLTLAFGDFNSDGRSDLVLAAPYPMVAVLHGHSDGLHPAPLPQASTPGEDAWWPVHGDREADPTREVAVGDITGDGNHELVIGPGVFILGTDTGLGTATTTWPVDAIEDGGVAVLPLSGGTHAWMTVGVQVPRTPTLPEYAGEVVVLRGTRDGTVGPVTVRSQDSPGIKGKAQEWDLFGTPPGG